MSNLRGRNPQIAHKTTDVLCHLAFSQRWETFCSFHTE